MLVISIACDDLPFERLTLKASKSSEKRIETCLDAFFGAEYRPKPLSRL